MFQTIKVLHKVDERSDIPGYKCSWTSEFVSDYNRGKVSKCFAFFDSVYELVCFQRGSGSEFHWDFSSNVPVALQDPG